MATTMRRATASSLNGFFQPFPPLGNQWHADTFLQSWLKRVCPSDVYAGFSPDLERMGDLSVTTYKAMGENADANLPYVQHYDTFGRRIDKLVTSEGWRQLHDVSAREGLVAIAYERKYGRYSRLYQMAKQYLWSPDTAVYGCPLAMTDGAARLIERSNDAHLKESVYPHLISRDPSRFWTSGQWMTERPGGSDVGRTETEAWPDPDNKGQFIVGGFKWFSSATDSDMTLLLARQRDEQGKVQPGSKGLSLFFAKVRNEDGSLNGIRIQRLKNKLGNKALPTAELELDGMKAIPVGPAYRGVPTISTILNITRVYTAMSSVCCMRRGVNMATHYAQHREAFGALLSRHPLHVRVLADLEMRTRASCAFLFDVVALLGRSECDAANEADEVMLRLLTPILKLFTAKEGIAVASEVIEAFGGQGFVEDTGVAKYLRNVQVSAIWEGTTNILALDVLRVLGAAASASPALHPLTVYTERVRQMAESAKGMPELAQAVERIRETSKALAEAAKAPASKAEAEVAAREFSYGLARVYSGALLLQHAAHTRASEDVIVAQRWCTAQPLFTPVADASKALSQDALIVFGPRARL